MKAPFERLMLRVLLLLVLMMVMLRARIAGRLWRILRFVEVRAWL